MNAPQHHDDAHPLNTDARIAVMSVQMQHIGEAVSRIEAASTGNVPRTEWEQRNIYVDSRFMDLSQKLAEAQARRAPWWAIVGAGAGFVAVMAFLVDFIPKIVN